MTDAWLEDLPIDACLERLRAGAVGRIAVVVNGFPLVFPVNYTLVETSGPRWVAIRTRPGGVIEQAPVPVAFEIDGVDPVQQRGWSVLVRGTLHHVDPDAADFRDRFDPQPWLVAERDAWLVIDPFAISGRRLNAEQVAWLYETDGYL